MICNIYCCILRDSEVFMLKNYLNSKISMPKSKELLKIIENEVHLLEKHDLQADFIALCDLCLMLKSIKAPYWLPGKTANSYLLYILGVTSFNPISYGLNFSDCFAVRTTPRAYVFEMRLPMFYLEDSMIFLKNHKLMTGKELDDCKYCFKIGNISLVKFHEEYKGFWDPPFVHPVRAGNIFGDTLVKFILTEYKDEQFHKTLGLLTNKNEPITFEHCMRVLGFMLGSWDYPDKLQEFLELKLDILTAPIFDEDRIVVFNERECVWEFNAIFLFPKAHCIEYLIYQFRCAGLCQ